MRHRKLIIPKEICVNPMHKRSFREYSRGLCIICYNAARKLVMDGHATWEKLEAEGKARPERRKRRRSDVQKWFLDSAMTQVIEPRQEPYLIDTSPPNPPRPNPPLEPEKTDGADIQAQENARKNA